MNMKKCEMNILFTSSGRRVSLIQKFSETMREFNISGKIITADNKENAPSAFFGEKHHKVSKVNEEGYVLDLLEVCKKEDINLLIPLIDTELLLLAENRGFFEKQGVKVLVSSGNIIEIANDKLKTFRFFRDNWIATPKVFNDEEIRQKAYSFPLIVKPRDGSSSKGVTLVSNEEELKFFKNYIRNSMVQEYIEGTEFTIDVMVDFKGNIKTIVPRERLETRSGEVSKGVTKKDFEIIEAAEAVIKALPGAVGCITLQCFKKENGEITFLEINPRFGGGIPLTIEAGANFPLWTLELANGKDFEEQDYSWKNELTMLRFDQAIYTESFIYEDKCISV